jgi:hypothetical protein
MTVYYVAATSTEAKPRMSKLEVVAIGKRAIEARFPGATKNRTFDAVVITDGYWAVFSSHPGQPNPLKRGEPVADVKGQRRKSGQRLSSSMSHKPSNQALEIVLVR